MCVYSIKARRESSCFILFFIGICILYERYSVVWARSKLGNWVGMFQKRQVCLCFVLAFCNLLGFVSENIPCCRSVYEELRKYGDLENQVLCRERVEELEPSIRYCLHKIGKSNLQTSELLQIGEMEGPALDLFKAKIEVHINFHDQKCHFLSVLSPKQVSN